MIGLYARLAFLRDRPPPTASDRATGGRRRHASVACPVPYASSLSAEQRALLSATKPVLAPDQFRAWDGMSWSAWNTKRRPAP